MPPHARSADPLAAAADLRARGVPFVLATVVRAVSPTSAKPGDKALVTEGGVLSGWIGGSCAEPIVRREAAAALSDGECRLLHITPDPQAEAGRPGLTVHRMECYSGGALEIYLEPYLPMPALLVFGNSPVAGALRDLGRVMGYRVTVVDLGDRPPMNGGIDAPGAAGDPGAAAVVRDVDALTGIDPGATYAVVASHGMFDEQSLAKALSLDLPYVGLVASARRRDEVFARLRQAGIAPARVDRIVAPAGLEIGARQPHEVALAILAQIVTVRRASRLEARRDERPDAPADPRPEARLDDRPEAPRPRAPEPEPARAESSCCHHDKPAHSHAHTR